MRKFPGDESSNLGHRQSESVRNQHHPAELSGFGTANPALEIKKGDRRL
jgi:hypothetical protein